MSLQKEYELVCQIFNDNFTNEDIKQKAFNEPNLFISAPLLSDNERNLCELLYTARCDIDKRKTTEFSIIKRWCSTKNNINSGMYKVKDGYIINKDSYALLYTKKEFLSIPVKEDLRFEEIFNKIVSSTFNNKIEYTKTILENEIRNIKLAIDYLKSKRLIDKTYSPIFRLHHIYLNANTVLDIFNFLKDEEITIYFNRNIDVLYFTNGIEKAVLLPISPKTIDENRVINSILNREC